MPLIKKTPKKRGGVITIKQSIIGLIIFLMIINEIFVITASANSIASTRLPISVSAGNTHTLLLTSDGNVWGWGDNSKGECGTDKVDTNGNILEPAQVRITNVMAIASGPYFSMAVKNDGTVWTWGDNEQGQLGIGTIDNDSHTTPIQVQSLPKIKAISTKDCLIMALDDDGNVWTWGINNFGQLGDGELIPEYNLSSSDDFTKWLNAKRPVPGKVIGLSDVSMIAAGGDFALAVKNDGTIWGWGINSEVLSDNEKNPGREISKSTPVIVQKFDNVRAITTGAGFVLVLKDNGSVWGWGQDTNGILQNSVGPHFINVPTPIQIKGLASITAITSGSRHAVALGNDGTVWTWGANFYGQIGEGSIDNDGRKEPYQLPISGVRLISAGSLYTIALSDTGVIWAWGSDDHGELGDGTFGDGSFAHPVYQSRPIKVSFDFSQNEQMLLSSFINTHPITPTPVANITMNPEVLTPTMNTPVRFLDNYGLSIMIVCILTIISIGIAYYFTRKK